MEIPKNIREKWSEMTCWNNHTEVLVEIADFFNLSDYKNCFEGILQSQCFYGSLEYEDMLLRNSACKNMMKEIREKHGDVIWKQVSDCL